MTDYLHRDPTRRDELLTIEQVADLIRMPVATLRYWRVLDSGPCGCRLSSPQRARLVALGRGDRATASP